MAALPSKAKPERTTRLTPGERGYDKADNVNNRDKPKIETRRITRITLREPAAEKIE
jgi:hypothetical protein